MPQYPRGEVFTTASAYHAAMARYCQALCAGEDMEAPTQELLGRSLFYRSVLEALILRGGDPSWHRQLQRLKTILDGASRQYMAAKRNGTGA